MITTNYY